MTETAEDERRRLIALLSQDLSLDFSRDSLDQLRSLAEIWARGQPVLRERGAFAARCYGTPAPDVTPAKTKPD